ncbi:MAG: FCD domain-containing protein [Hyphomicrobiales bacterium]|nr:FCD domain-containing protein [Hyphomicrobiales bacterium]
MTPVREAIRKLTAEGALELQGNRRVCVPQLTTRQMDELAFARLAIEPKLARMAADRLQPSDIYDLSKIDAEIDRAIADGDVVRIFNDRGACLTVAKLSDTILRGVLELQTGAWYDPQHPGQIGALDKHGNPNVLTSDRGTSQLSQATAAQSCLVQVEKWHGSVPDVTVFDPPVVLNKR